MIKIGSRPGVAISFFERSHLRRRAAVKLCSTLCETKRLVDAEVTMSPLVLLLNLVPFINFVVSPMAFASFSMSSKRLETEM